MVRLTLIMSVESSKPIRSDAGEAESQDISIRSPSIRVTTPKKSLALRLWVLLQPLARLWGLITAVGKYIAIKILQI